MSNETSKERYSRLFSLPENLYTEGAPVIVSAGALLKDNQTGKVLVQLKFKNITPKTISAVVVSVSAFAVSGKELQGVDEYQYLDLAANRDAFFGSKTAFPLSDNVTRSFTVNIKSVIFRDGSIWENIGAEVRQLAEQRQIDAALGNLAQQYKRDTGSTTNTLITEDRDLWICRCAAINKAHEETCHKCGAEKAKLLDALDVELLKQHKEEHDAAEAKAEEERLALEEAERIERERKAEEDKIRAAANKKKAKKIAAIVIPSLVAVAAIVILTIMVFIPNSKYNDAVALMNAGQYAEAIVAFEEIDGYKDSTTQINECKYSIATDLMNNGDYSNAIKAFSEIQTYKDSADKTTECKKILFIEENGQAAYDNWGVVEIGDYISLGKYEKDNNKNNGKEDIEWLVLDVQDGKALVISKNAIDCIPYNSRYYVDVTWKTCTLRKWLNSAFIANTFSDSEEACILYTTVPADRNPEENTDPGEATQDRVFLLSIPEAEYYFNESSELRKCLATSYAISKGALNDDFGCSWWLRTPGTTSWFASYVRWDGNISEYGQFVNFAGPQDEADDYDYIAVRPAMIIDLSVGD